MAIFNSYVGHYQRVVSRGSYSSLTIFASSLCSMMNPRPKIISGHRRVALQNGHRWNLARTGGEKVGKENEVLGDWIMQGGAPPLMAASDNAKKKDHVHVWWVNQLYKLKCNTLIMISLFCSDSETISSFTNNGWVQYGTVTHPQKSLLI